jgi:hypothetical protein
MDGIDTAPQSRRSLLAALVGGAGALLAGALGRPAPVAAATHDTVKLGEVNTFDGTFWPYTLLQRSDVGTSASIAGNDYGLHASSVVAGGSALSGYNTADDSQGLRLISSGSRAKAVEASFSGTDAIGVEARSSGHYSQIAVLANASDGLGEGYAVRALTKNGIALYGKATGGYALQVKGRAVFSQSGLAAFSAGQSSRSITAPVAVTAKSLVLATIQGDIAGTWVRGVAINVANGTFTIRLNIGAPTALKVGWFIVN